MRFLSTIAGLAAAATASTTNFNNFNETADSPVIPSNSTVDDFFGSGGLNTLQLCSDVQFPNDDSLHATDCLISDNNIAAFQFDFPSIDADASVNYTSSLTRRGKKKKQKAKAALPEIPRDARLLWKEAEDEDDNQFKQCLNTGPRPTKKHIQKLCNHVNNSYIIRRADQEALKGSKDPRAGPCVCKIWNYKSAVFSLCNCDRCDALVVPFGLRAKCREISQHCTGAGYSSGYIQLPDAGAVFEQYTATKEGQKNVTAMMPGDLPQMLNVTCRSGNETRAGQDKSRNLVHCKRKGAVKKCWRETNPKFTWYQW